MSQWFRFSGILGLVLFLFGALGGTILGSFTQPLMLIHILAGVLLLLIWFFVVGVRSARDAGAVIRGRTVRFGANALLYSFVFIGMLVAVNWYFNRHDARWDLTEEGVFSLAPQTVSTIKNLKKPLKLVAVTDDPNVDETRVKETFDLYRYHNPSMVKTDTISARTKPQLLDTYGMKPGNIVYLEYGEGDSKSVSRINEFTEEAITNGILKLTRGAAKKIYFVQGHDEPALSAMTAQGLKKFADAVSDEHLTMEGLLLSKASTLPEDAAAVLLVSPKKPLLDQEKQTLIKYADGGGRLVMFADPRTTGDVKELASHFGITVGDDVVIDQIQRLFDAPALGAQPVVSTYAQHPITKNFSPQDYTVFNIASSVQPAAQSNETITYTELLKTEKSAWGEKNLALVFDSDEPTATLDKDDVPGPVSLGVAYEKRLADQKPEGGDSGNKVGDFEKVSRVVVFGDSDFINNGSIG